MKATKLLMAIAVTAIALPVAAQSTPAAAPKMESEKDGQQLTPAKKKTPEQIAKEKADKEKIRADANKPAPPSEAARTQLKGAETPAKPKTAEQIAKEKASKEKRGSTPEADEKAKKLGGQ